MNPVQAVLLSNAAATGNAVFFSGGIADFECVGTFSGATITLQKLMPDQATWAAVGASTTVTAAAFVQGLNLPAGIYRALITGGPPSGMYVAISASLD